MKATSVAIILTALALKETSINRAKKTSNSPRFDAVYDAELKDLAEARADLYATQQEKLDAATAEVNKKN